MRTISCLHGNLRNSQQKSSEKWLLSLCVIITNLDSANAENCEESSMLNNSVKSLHVIEEPAFKDILKNASSLEIEVIVSLVNGAISFMSLGKTLKLRK